MRYFLLLIAFFLLVVQRPAAASINLSDLQPLPGVSATAVKPLRVAVAAIISPKGTVDSYGPLLDYLAEELRNRPVELVQRRTYGEVNNLVKAAKWTLPLCVPAPISWGSEILECSFWPRRR